MDPTLQILLTFLLTVLAYILGILRDNNKQIFNKKLEIYSDIVYYISSAKDLRLDWDISIDTFKTLVKEIDSLKEKIGIEHKEDNLETKNKDKLKEIERKAALLDYKDHLIKLFAPARLLGSKAVANELREYYSLVSEEYSVKNKKDIENLSKKISKSTMELEQLMREDLGNFRILSKSKIRRHLQQ